MKQISLFLLIFSISLSSFSAVIEENDAIMDHRPAVAKRCFRSKTVEKKIQSMQKTLMAVNPKLWYMFQNCFPNTLDTTVSRYTGNNSVNGSEEDFTFVITGDINAMWLRDSGAQVWTYMPFIREDKELQKMIRGVIRQQFQFICRDPYANAFLRNLTDTSEWQNDFTAMKPGIHERKYEIDSLCYPLRLAYEYWKQTGDDTIFDELWLQAMTNILTVFTEQQRKDGIQQTSYRFGRKTTAQHDTTSNYGVGHPVRPCGLIASMFRPSDDSCIFPFLVPSNIFAEDVLRKASEMLVHTRLRDTAGTTPDVEALKRRCLLMADQIHSAISRYAIVQTAQFGNVYAFEIDGFGSQLLMDDANVPSLLSLPYLCPDLVSAQDSVYQNTRRMIWSDSNPYFFGAGIQGMKSGIRGIGSQHTGLNKVWPMSIIMKGLTSTSRDEQRQCIQALLETDGGTCFMHESFNPANPTDYTRSWFAWANGLFAELVIKAYGDCPISLTANH